MRNFAYWYINDVFNKEELTTLESIANSINAPELYDRPADHVTKTANVKLLPWRPVKSLVSRAFDAAKHVNSTEIGYDLYDFTDNNTVNYNIYDSAVKAEYDWHTDATGDSAPTDLKLTVVINVSTSRYTGGKFELFRHKILDTPEFDIPGTMIVFPGFINHRVTPVTSGIRKSLSFWIHGPKWR